MWCPDILEINQANSYRDFDKSRGVTSFSRSCSWDGVATDDGTDTKPVVRTQGYGPANNYFLRQYDMREAYVIRIH